MLYYLQGVAQHPAIAAELSWTRNAGIYPVGSGALLDMGFDQPAQAALICAGDAIDQHLISVHLEGRDGLDVRSISKVGELVNVDLTRVNKAMRRGDGGTERSP